MNRDWFNHEMARMVGLKFPPESLDEHFTGLSDIPPEVLTEAVSHAIKTRVWFPQVAELRADCDAVTMRSRPIAVHPTSHMVPMDGARMEEIRNPFDAGKSLTVAVTEEPRYYCERCRDYGTESFWCDDRASDRWPWMPVARCSRREAHDPHDWAGPCACVDHNPAIARRKEAHGMKYGREPEKVA